MTKTKKRSRFFAVALAIVLVMALAVPSFAAGGSSRLYGFPEYRIIAGNANGRMLNIERSYSGNLRGMTNVTIYNQTGSTDQRWWHNPRLNTIGPVISHVYGPGDSQYALNFYRTATPNCVVYSYIESGGDGDFLWNSNMFTFEDNGKTYYMTAAANANNANVYWTTAGNALSSWAMGG